MALDWSKEISFSGLRKRTPRQKDVYPEKTYMNLVVSDKKSIDLGRTIPLAIILVIVVALIVKFGILDVYGRVGVKQAELSTEKQALSTMTAAIADYDAVLAEYEGYASASIAGDEVTVQAVDALDLVDRFVSPSARVASVALSGNTLSLSLTNVSLDGVGRLVSSLYEQKIVENVSVSTAATQATASEDVTVAVTITLAPLTE